MIKACLFDIFGILVSSTKCDGGVGKENVPYIPHDQSTDTLMTPLTVLSPGESRERMHENVKTFFEYNSAQLPDMILPGALDFVKDLHRQGIKLASTATNCRPKSVLSSIGLYSMFDYIVEPGTVAERPSPEALLKAANHLGLDPEECIAVENTPEGVEAAKAAGIRCLGVGELADLYLADMAVPNLKELNLLAVKDGLEAPRYSC